MDDARPVALELAHAAPTLEQLVHRWAMVRSATLEYRLSGGDLAVLVAITERLTPNGDAEISAAMLAEDTLLSSGQVHQCLARLEQHGLLMREKTDQRGVHLFRI